MASIAECVCGFIKPCNIAVNRLFAVASNAKPLCAALSRLFMNALTQQCLCAASISLFGKLKLTIVTVNANVICNEGRRCCEAYANYCP